MKIITAVDLVLAACVVTVSAAAWPQNADTASVAASAQSASAIAAPAGRQADRALRRRIYAAIGKDKEISAGDISVVAKDGAVTLNGTVTEQAQIGKVEAIVKGVAGVTSVLNRLTVKKPFGGM
ncbi:hyperosmotically inducible protein [Paraburkholderia sp. GAS199]|uniref:BON domain-containing protein n=1 Tax=Paraburkholderia sp. GAS199 TaxID=3035126 RepID=UPI003D25E9B0